MNNNKKTLSIVLLIILVFVGAYVGYNILGKNAPDNSYMPTVNTVSSEDFAPPVVATVASSAKEEQAPSKDESTAEVVENPMMPDIPVKMYSGEESTFWQVVEKGKPVVINLFASWCPPCKAEMPGFVSAREDYIDDVTFIFFDSFDGVRENEKALKAFVDEYFAEDTLIVLDPGYLSSLFGTNSIPVTIILNEKGEVVNGFQGSISKEVLTTELDKLLNK